MWQLRFGRGMQNGAVLEGYLHHENELLGVETQVPNAMGNRVGYPYPNLIQFERAARKHTL